MSGPRGRTARKARPATGRQRRTDRVAYLFLAPFLALFIVFTVLPIALAAYDSLFAVRYSGLGLGGGTLRFVGLQNYGAALTSPDLLSGVLRMIVFGLVQVPVMLGVALALALVLDSSAYRLHSALRTVYLLPYAVPIVIGTLAWGFLYTPQMSPLSDAVKALGGPADLLGETTVLWSMGNVVTWSYTGINMTILYTSLRGLPRDVYEAARLDGAGEFRIAWSVKVPQLVPALIMTTIMSVIGTLQIFTEPTILGNLTPAISPTYTPNMTIQTVAIGQQNPQLAAATAIVLAAVTFLLSLGFLTLAERRSSR
ncbi:carbohydrate ABC transporter permease [Streptomyces sclerotialus]|uniref:carbohydrate ABC transporter permease n=1 Tax=Streptomyces sclerotialus TaxID=1957 RepID=UPI0004C7C8B7